MPIEILTVGTEGEGEYTVVLTNGKIYRRQFGMDFWMEVCQAIPELEDMEHRPDYPQTMGPDMMGQLGTWTWTWAPANENEENTDG